MCPIRLLWLMAPMLSLSLRYLRSSKRNKREKLTEVVHGTSISLRGATYIFATVRKKSKLKTNFTIQLPVPSRLPVKVAIRLSFSLISSFHSSPSPSQNTKHLTSKLRRAGPSSYGDWNAVCGQQRAEVSLESKHFMNRAWMNASAGAKRA